MSAIADRYTLTVVEASSRLGVSPRTLYGWCERGIVPHLKVGQRVLVPVVALEEWMETQTQGPVAVRPLQDADATAPSHSAGPPHQRRHRRVLSEEP